VNGAAQALEGLQQQLQALHAALAADDDARAAELVLAHDHDLRNYLNQHGTADRPALADLLQRQGQAMADLRARREAAAHALREGRRSRQAARAYLRAGAI